MTEINKNTADAASEKLRSILKERALRVAALPQTNIPAAEKMMELTEFTLSGEKYAFESAHIREVRPLEHITPLPGVPAFILGIINVRSEILSVIDLRKFFDLPEKGLTNLNKVIILSSPEMEFGVLADDATGGRVVNADNLVKTLVTLTGIREEYLMGVTTDRTAVLDAGKLLSDKRIIVREGVET
ncbi:purine-binding chemotaxis protein CheW [bacterium]|nr:MAG: purine-binding chemotaxis protein CheW [bacterium]